MQKQEEPKIIGAAYRQLIELIKKYAQNDKPVLFVGETGSGKEVFARLYIQSSGRKGNWRTEICAGYFRPTSKV